MSAVVLMGDPKVANVQVIECGEALVPAGDEFVTSLLVAGVAPARTLVRAGVMDRLLVAQTHLPDGYRIAWVEGQRPVQTQRHYFDKYRDHLKSLDPSLSDQDSYLLASRYVSPPDLAPHVSGAAIDLTLCDRDGNELDLGSPVNASPEESDGACYFDAPVSAEARAHRTLLSNALEEAGMVNYPTEWWHWSYGDRYWAMTTGAPAAVYGPITE